MKPCKTAYKIVRRDDNEIYKGFGFRHLSQVQAAGKIARLVDFRHKAGHQYNIMRLSAYDGTRERLSLFWAHTY